MHSPNKAAPKAPDIAAPKAPNKFVAPKAQNIKARGKREARRPWLAEKAKRALKVRNIDPGYFALSELVVIRLLVQGRRASLCSALTPGCYIPRLWRASGNQSASRKERCAYGRGLIRRRILLDQVSNCAIKLVNRPVKLVNCRLQNDRSLPLQPL